VPAFWPRPIIPTYRFDQPRFLEAANALRIARPFPRPRRRRRGQRARRQRPARLRAL